MEEEPKSSSKDTTFEYPNEDQTISNEKIYDLKRLIDEKLRSDKVYDQIRDLIRSKLTQERNKTESNDNETVKSNIMESVVEMEAIKNILETIGTSDDLAAQVDTQEEESAVAAQEINSNRALYLQLRLLRGRAFLDEMLEEKDNASTSTDGSISYFRLSITYRQQRFRSRDVECKVEPTFDETFLINIRDLDDHEHPERHYRELAKQACHDQQPIILTLVRVSKPKRIEKTKLPSSNKEIIDEVERLEVIAVHSLEWRRVFGRGSVVLPVELQSMNKEGDTDVPLGILEFHLDMLPTISHANALPASEITACIQKDKKRDSENNRRFYQYARRWWEEYTEIHPSFKERLVKLFVEDEFGRYRSVCSYIQPLAIKNCNIHTSRQAARFVSLFPYHRCENIGGGKRERWYTFPTFLALGRGDCEEHSLLLASILLGFGLDAYVCVGTIFDEVANKKIGHVWVLSRDGSVEKPNVYFWESLKGQKYRHVSLLDQKENCIVKPKYPFSTIDCVFNHQSYFANIQINNSVHTCNFELENEQLWKAMSTEHVQNIRHQEPVAFIPPRIQVRGREEELEFALRSCVASFRREKLGLSTYWNERMRYIIGPALESYEIERMTGVCTGTEEFQTSIRRFVPAGQTFKGFPTVFNHSMVGRMITALEGNAIANDILSTRGNKVQFAVRVRVFSFPERLTAVWLMLAVKYTPSLP